MQQLTQKFPNAATQAELESPLVLPIPTMLDSSAAVLLHLLLQGFPDRTIILDAAALHAVGEVGALLLASTLMRRSRRAPAPRIVNLSYALRVELSRHPLLSYADAAGQTPPLAPPARALSAVG